MALSDYAINGLFLTKSVMGIQRYAHELLLELDQMVEKDALSVVVPIGTSVPECKNLQLIEYGYRSGILWEQIDFAKYLKDNNRKSINFCNTLPLMQPAGITVIHDISYKVNPAFFKGIRNRLSMCWHRLNYRYAVKHCEQLVTVSKFSKSEICRAYGVVPDRVSVIPNAWQHMDRIKSDNNILAQHSLKLDSYFYTVSSLAPNKNISWIIKTAKLNPDEKFIIAGGAVTAERLGNIPSNVKLIGYVTDEESKSLMQNCKAFLFPTLYEGFGIPPLEALACGAKAIVSDTPCMHEVYGNSVHYIDPYDANVNLNDVLKQSTSLCKDALLKYSWNTSARILLDILASGNEINI